MLPPLLLPAVLALATGADELAPSGPISATNLRAHIDFLADDRLEGRDSGFPGAELAAKYIETWFRTHGVAPLLPDGYAMEVPIRGAADAAQATLTVGDLSHQASAAIEALGFSGAGVFDADLTTGDDVEGRLLLLPGGDDERKAREVADEALAAGAVGVVFISADEQFTRRSRPDPRRRYRAGTEGGGYLPFEAEALAAGAVIRVNRLVGASLLERIDHAPRARLEVQREGRDVTTNVIGWFEGADPKLRDEYVIIGAHYDHVGLDAHGNIWNGADDNASGTSAVLQMAAALAASDARPRRSIVLALWGAEERGLFGSKEFAKQAPVPLDRVAAYVNLDMISRNDPGSVQVVHASDDLFALSKDAGDRQGLAVQEGFSFFLNSSDTEPFVRAEVPTVFFFTGLHEDYHTPSDDPPTADADKAARVARAAFDLAVTVANGPERPSFTAPSRRGGSFRAQGRRLGISLGDKEEGEEGIRVRTVAPSSVAGEAGVLADDRIVRIAGLPVRSLAELREAIRAPKTGEEFSIDVLRGAADEAEFVSLSAVFESD